MDDALDGGEEAAVRVAQGSVRPVLADHPDGLDGTAGDPDPERSQRAMKAMLEMKKIDIEGLRRAAEAA